MSSSGSITCVGIGMTLGAHITPQAKQCIVESDVVFVAASSGVVEKWIEGMHHDVRSLQPYYAADKPRTQTYREMVDAMMTEVRAGKNVCGAFYGHPGVFAKAPHDIIAVGKAEGYRAIMLPGISAEDCLWADLGLDPGQSGCQQYEASQLLFSRRPIDTAAILVLWQVGVVGDSSFTMRSTGTPQRKLLTERLLEHYPPDHSAILYEASTLPTFPPRKEIIQLVDLPGSSVRQETTLVIPALGPAPRDESMFSKLRALAGC